MPYYNNGNLHILKGTGDNCSCHDCVVLYGGECYTTPINNMLDDMEAKLELYLAKTPTGREKKKTGYAIDSAIEKVMMPIFKKEAAITKTVFYKKYYAFLPLVYLMTSEAKHNDRRLYARARMSIYLDIREGYDRLNKGIE